MHCQKPLLEAQLRIRRRACEDWLKQGGNVCDELFKAAVATLRCEMTRKKKICDDRHQQFYTLFRLLDSFEESGGVTISKFSSSFTDMVSSLLIFIQAAREGYWKQHIPCIRKILLWIFAYERHNYSRNLSYYWCTKVNLETSHTEAFSPVVAGEFAAQHSTFTRGQLAFDLSIEKTLNRDTKTHCGIIGLSRKPRQYKNGFSMLTKRLKSFGTVA